MNQHPSSENNQPLTPAVYHILLALSEGEQHGYRIMQIVAGNSQGQFHMGPGTLYGTIKRMLSDGLIEEAGDQPDPVKADERRRYYRLTDAGRQALVNESLRMAQLVERAQALHLLPASKGG
jgi:DNA-binding PadR family transcriptional regulator